MNKRAYKESAVGIGDCMNSDACLAALTYALQFKSVPSKHLP